MGLSVSNSVRSCPVPQHLPDAGGWVRLKLFSIQLAPLCSRVNVRDILTIHVIQPDNTHAVVEIATRKMLVDFTKF